MNIIFPEDILSEEIKELTGKYKMSLTDVTHGMSILRVNNSK